MLSPLHVTTHGSGEKIALLIHGLGGSSETWTDLSILLAQHGYTCISPDLRGHGKSGIAEHYSIDNWVADIVSMGIKPDLLIGHSIGGLIASRLQSVYFPEQTILLDPVFRLPKSTFALKIVQKVFKRNMMILLKARKEESATQETANASKELAMLDAWDTKTIEALIPDTLLVADVLSSKSKTLLIRAKRSYIAPRKLAKKASQNIHLWQFPSSHDIHRDCLEALSIVIKDFIQPKLSPAFA